MWSLRRISDFCISERAARSKSSIVIRWRFPRRSAFRIDWRTTFRIEPPERAYRWAMSPKSTSLWGVAPRGGGGVQRARHVRRKDRDPGMVLEVAQQHVHVAVRPRRRREPATMEHGVRLVEEEDRVLLPRGLEHRLDVLLGLPAPHVLELRVVHDVQGALHLPRDRL